MYKFFLYTILVILYLGLAKTLSPSELGVQYLQNEKGFNKLIKGTNATAILVDTHATGFLIKTYYQKYRVITGYDNVEEIIVRTSREQAKRNLLNIGLSVYRRSESKEEFVPLPPGSLYIGHHEYGEWKVHKHGRVVWRFNKTLKNFPRYLGWGNFRPDLEFYQQMKISSSLGRPFYGLNNEFGSNGEITRKAFPHFFKDGRKKRVEMKTLLIEYFKENF
jgi:hypothetical protein